MSAGIDQLGLHRVRDGGLAVSGALAAESFQTFEATVFQLGSEQTTRIDLSGCTFLDSSGVTALLRLNSFLASSGEQLELLNPSRPCRRVLEICGLLDVFTITDATTNDPAPNRYDG